MKGWWVVEFLLDVGGIEILRARYGGEVLDGS
jgi:hypothetical protein